MKLILQILANENVENKEMGCLEDALVRRVLFVVM